MDNKNNVINIAYCTDANYLEYVAVSIMSVIMNNPEQDLSFFVFVYDVTDEEINKLRSTSDKIQVINIDNLNYEYKKIITMRRAGKTLTEIGKEVNKSSVKVRQIIESIKKDQRKMSQQPRATLNQKNHSEMLDEETNQLRRMFIFGEGGSARYFYGE